MTIAGPSRGDEILVAHDGIDERQLRVVGLGVTEEAPCVQTLGEPDDEYRARCEPMWKTARKVFLEVWLTHSPH